MFPQRKPALDSNICRSAMSVCVESESLLSKKEGFGLRRLRPVVFPSSSLCLSVPHRAWAASSQPKHGGLTSSAHPTKGVSEEWIFDFRLWDLSLLDSPEAGPWQMNYKKRSPKFRKTKQHSQISQSLGFLKKGKRKKKSISLSEFRKGLCVHSPPAASLRKSHYCNWRVGPGFSGRGDSRKSSGCWCLQRGAQACGSIFKVIE